MRPLLLLLVLALLAVPPATGQGVSSFENRWKSSERLAVEGGALSSVSSTNDSWVTEPVDATYVRLRNLNTGLYLHNQNGPPEAGEIEPGWWSAMWVLEPAGTSFVRLRNRWRGTYLHNQNGPLELGEIEDGWWSAMWAQSTVQTRMAFSRSTTNVEAHLGSLLANHTEYGISGGISSHAGTHIQGLAAVGTHWVLSHDNGGNRDGDLIVIDPATREHVGTHTLRFTGDDGYMAAAQGNGDYLAVGTGTNKAVRVVSVSADGAVTELTNLALADPFGNGGRVENVAFAYHPGHRRHYLLVVNGSTNRLFVSSGPALESATWSVVPPSTGSGSVPYGEAGIALLYDEAAGHFYVVSLGQDGSASDEENAFSIWTLTPTDAVSPTNDWREFTARAASPEHRQLRDGSGSFRWGGTAHVLGNGNVQIIAAPRDFKLIGDSDFGVWTSQPTWASTAVATAPTPDVPTIRVQVTSVKCVETTEWGEDEVYLTVDGTRYPSGNESYHDINNGDSWSVGASATSTSGVTLTLMEYDTTDDRDLIGTISIPIQKIHGTYTDTLRGDDGVYEVTYQVSGR